MTDATFPCPTCGAPLEVRQTKKSKPYLICDTCGMQMFVRNGVGIHRFEVLLAEFDGSDIWKRLAVLEERYRKQCPRCGYEFWVEDRLMQTSILDGSLQGYRCPKAGCKGTVKMEGTKK